MSRAQGDDEVIGAVSRTTAIDVCIECFRRRLMTSRPTIDTRASDALRIYTFRATRVAGRQRPRSALSAARILLQTGDDDDARRRVARRSAKSNCFRADGSNYRLHFRRAAAAAVVSSPGELAQTSDR